MKRLIFIILIFLSSDLFSAEGASPLVISITRVQDEKLIVPRLKLFHNSTVKDLNELIYSWWGTPADQQYLEFDNIGLNNKESELKDYGIKTGSNIYLQNKNAGDFFIKAQKGLRGPIHSLNVNPEITVSELKDSFNSQDYGFVVPVYILLGKKILKDDEKLKDVGLEDGSNIIVIPKPQR
ncbi:MAG: ubiquitin family protein [Candidatus Babeliales bacterium]|nr:ubiquitin family protein [Candidatus Babeliales bacterium]